MPLPRMKNLLTWKNGTASFSNKQSFKIAPSKTGPSSKGKFYTAYLDSMVTLPRTQAYSIRKLLSYALESPNISLSNEILDSMHEESRSNPLTLYLVYKLDLLDEDRQLGKVHRRQQVFLYGLLTGENTGSELLENYLAVDQRHLLSCVVEAEKLGKTRQAIDIFQGVIACLDESEQETKGPGIFQCVFRFRACKC